jgi:hypothetical protein
MTSKPVRFCARCDKCRWVCEAQQIGLGKGRGRADAANISDVLYEVTDAGKAAALRDD